MNEREIDTLVTALAMLFLRLVRLLDSYQRGIPIEDLEPVSLLELDEEAQSLVEQIKKGGAK